MKIKPSTFFLVLVALLLGGISLMVMQQPAPDRATQTGQTSEAEERRVFEFEEGDVQALTLTTPLRTLKFERDPDGKWQMLEPTKTAANDPSIAFLLDLVSTGKTQRSFTVPATDRNQYGLHQPLATIEVTLKNKETHQLVVGEYNFNRSHLYAQVDPPAAPESSTSASPAPNAKIEVLLVSPNFEAAVGRPLDEWKQPAAAAKSSPSPNASAGAPSPSPPTSETQTPSPDVPEIEPSESPDTQSPDAPSDESPQAPPKSSASPAPTQSPAEAEPQPSPDVENSDP